MIDSARAAEIAEEYYSYIYSYCYSFRHCKEQDAEDITQEVFLLFQQQADKLEDKYIKAWLTKVAENKVHEYFRNVKKANNIAQYNEALDTTEDIFALLDEYFPVEDEQIEKYKAIILKSFTKEEAELYRKIYIEHKRYKDIAEEMNITENAVTLRALRLRKKVRKMITIMLSSIGQMIIKMFF